VRSINKRDLNNSEDQVPITVVQQDVYKEKDKRGYIARDKL